MKILSLAVPLILNIVAVWNWRGSYRYAACIPLPFVALAFVGDVQMVIKGGNLAGLLTIFAGSPALLFLFILAIAKGFTDKESPTHLMAAVSSIFLFLAVLLVTYFALFSWNETRNIGYWSIGVLVAFGVSALSYLQNSTRVEMKDDEDINPDNVQ